MNLFPPPAPRLDRGVTSTPEAAVHLAANAPDADSVIGRYAHLMAAARGKAA